MKATIMIQPKHGEETLKSVCISNISSMEFDKYGYAVTIPKSADDSEWYTLVAQGYFRRINVLSNALVLVGNLDDIMSIANS